MSLDPSRKWWPPNGYLSQLILDQFPPGYRGHAIDVGASDGISVNTTWALEKNHGWTVVSVEPNPEFHPYLVAQRAMVEKCACDATSGEATLHIYQPHAEAHTALRPNKRKADQPGPWNPMPVKVKTVNEILMRWEFPKLDALCIDVEGNELDVLKGCDLELWKPKVLIVECWEEPTEIQAYIGPKYQRRFKSVDNHILIREES